MPKVRLSEIASAQFREVHRDVMSHRHTYYWLKGGRGSTKSSYISLEIPMLLIKNPLCHAVILRKVGNTIKNSIYPQMQWGIEQLGLSSKFTRKISPPMLVYKKTGQQILFLGCDDPQKIKSIKLPFGYVGFVWFEELDQFAGMEEIRNLNQSLLRGGSKFWEFCSFNPPKSQNNWVNEEQLLIDSSRMVHHSTYKDVPGEWLGEQFLNDAERLKEKNELAYRHEYLGEVTGTGGAVFDNVEGLQMSDDMVNSFDRLYHGLDFGFSMDPLAYVAMHYDKKHEELYIFDEIYQQKLKNSTAAELIRPRLKTDRLIADSAEPKSIAEMKDFGLRITGARKGRDSVEHGMKWLQDRAKIYIDPDRCPNTYREFMTYEYQRNRQGQFISAYPDENNHAIDATRYALSEVMRAGGIRIFK
ncbi:PBSX family phage terminase large subunit [Anaerovibrio sp.]|uniref:PBSX family phage terminase large subunit n=1 Tax=Anaerovibrio sp. TaxID=1872532 RepID=UPI0025B941A2|nr:PBSX family phage terminase large subunit [Anaerovibrio sp.]MBR2142073.1 PBSX family phage terminase large subunit [Anaerovibrio sp.]